jgi:opacity protein-like surface antigen
MKKINLILTASLLPLTVSATSSIDYFSGAYVGGGLGANFLSSSQELVFDPSKVANTARYNFNQSTNNSAILGQLYLGYGYLFSPKPVYVAVEAIADFSHPSFIMGSSNIDINLKQNNAYGGRVKLGYVHQAGLLYILAGVERASISRNVVFRNGGIYNSGTMSLHNLTGNNNGSIINQLGAGIDIALRANWVVQLEYAHNFYNDKNYTINHTLITFNNPKGAFSSYLEGNQVTLGVKYIWKH